MEIEIVAHLEEEAEEFDFPTGYKDLVEVSQVELFLRLVEIVALNLSFHELYEFNDRLGAFLLIQCTVYYIVKVELSLYVVFKRFGLFELCVVLVKVHKDGAGSF